MKATYRRPTGRQRGSTLVFAVVCLVLMVLLGTSYLQMSRVERLALTPRNQNNIDKVAAAAINQIATVVGTEDLFDSAGNYFIAQPAAANEPGDEGYDYPGTNKDQADPRNVFTVQPMNAAPAQAVGGHLDDSWLANTTPDCPTVATSVWPHITNLNGLYLRIPRPGGSQTQPEERVVDHRVLSPPTDHLHTDTDLEITGGSVQAMDDNSNANFLPYGVDADGDGLLDSRFTWATIRQIGAVRYVMAVRIVDMSSMINLNTATVLTADGDTTVASVAHTPRGYYPSDIDLSRLAKRTFTVLFVTPWEAELNALLGYRGLLMPLTTNPLDLGFSFNTTNNTFNYAAQRRVAAWFDIGRYYGVASRAGYQRFGQGPGLNDELELRHRFDLNNINLTSTLEDRMPTLLRREREPIGFPGDDDGDGKIDEVEASYLDVFPFPPPGPAAISLFAQGGPDTNSVDIRQQFAIRHYLTTASGAVPYAANHGGIHGGAHRLQYDLVLADGGPDTTNATQLQNRLSEVAQRVADVLKLGPQKYLALSDTELDKVAVEYALAIQDYADSDHNPSEWTIGSETFYGMELLPFIREVYLQAGYDDFDLKDANGNVQGSPLFIGLDGDFDTWMFHPDSQAVAVELGNPFDRPIDLGAAGRPRVRIVMMQGIGGVGTPVILPTTLVINPRDPLATALTNDTTEQVLVYSDATSAVTEGAAGNDLRADLGLGAVPAGQRVDAGNGTLTFQVNNTQVSFELQVEVSPNRWVAYDRFTPSNLSLDAPVPGFDHHTPLSPEPQTPAHGQVSARRDGRVIRYLSNAGGATQSFRRDPDTLGYRSQISANRIERFWEDDKGIGGDASLDNFQIPLANRQLLSLSELGWIFMYGFTDASTGDFPQRLSGANGTGGLDLRRRFLDFSPTADVPATTQIPHAAMILDQFTTVSTHADGVDNNDADGDGNPLTGFDELGEQLVPGQININTAPLPVSVLAAPLPEPVGEIESLMKNIADYRDNPGNRSSITGLSTVRTAAGIDSIGELMFVRGTIGSAEDMQRYGFDSLDNRVTDPQVDLYPVPEMPASVQSVSAADSAEERMARFQFLSNVYTTRSDLFCAYVTIRGYPAGDFRFGPIEATQFFVIYDRSGVTQSTDQVRIVGVYKIN